VITRKSVRWLLLGAIAYIIIVPPVASVITAIVVFVGYLISLQLHPHRACRSCGGTGRHSGAIWAYGNRPCGSCGSAGRHRRWGTQFFHPSKQVRAEARSTAATRRRARPL
jgi:hypothetical protein